MADTEDRLPDSRHGEPGSKGDASPKGPGPSVDGAGAKKDAAAKGGKTAGRASDNAADKAAGKAGGKAGGKAAGKAGGNAAGKEAPQMSEAQREALIKEAHDQTAAILRLEVYKRLGYSAVAVGVLLGYWNMWGGGPGWAMPVGVVLLLVGALVSFVLYMGISNAKKNVRAILTAAGVDPNMPKQEKKPKEKKARGKK